jgi:DNA-directed RNA polymerase sigma subunit (sigma70/sigma32)
MKIAQQRAIAKERGERIRAYIQSLKDQGKEVPSFDELGRMFNISREQARQDAQETQRATP